MPHRKKQGEFKELLKKKRSRPLGEVTAAVSLIWAVRRSLTFTNTANLSSYTFISQQMGSQTSKSPENPSQPTTTPKAPPTLVEETNYPLISEEPVRDGPVRVARGGGEK